jgi:hypothetical protein
MWQWLRKIVGSPGGTPADLSRLRAASEVTLTASLRNLPHGERGWISISEAAHLFSPMETEYAFGEMDEEGRQRLSDFAAKLRCEPQFMPAEGRLYFRRLN